MSQTRGLTIGSIAAALMMMLSTGQAVAQHLDRHETRRVVRRVEERSDVLFDRIDDWTEQSWDDRFARIGDLQHSADHFESVLADFKSQVRDREDPWELRDQVRDVIGAADELGRNIHRAVDDLARHYRLPPIER